MISLTDDRWEEYLVAMVSAYLMANDEQYQVSGFPATVVGDARAIVNEVLVKDVSDY